PVMKNATEKLSKRNGDASFEDLVAKGYLEEAVINYIALLGWAPKGENEVFTLDELIKEFDVSGISKSPAIFDPLKLKAINGAYIRRLTPEKFMEYALPYIRQTCKKEPLDSKLMAELLQPRTELFTDIPDQVDFIDTLPNYDIAMYTHKKMKTSSESSLDALQKILPVLSEVSDWSRDNIHEALYALIETLGVKNGMILWPLRVAVSGKPFTPGGGVELAEILGKDETLKRIQVGIEKLIAAVSA
ncbi:MAG: glutamate--tRNA ligase family protein, partial [Oscillospiraceae bacterium]